MGVQSLKQYRQKVAEREAQQEEYEANKLVWLKIADKQSVLVRPLQELDEDSKNYSAKNGLGIIAIEHVNPAPGKFQNKGLCTGDEGEPCAACEKHRELNATAGTDYKGGWKQKSKLYINVLVDNGKDEPYVAVLSSGVSSKSVIGSTLLGYDAENGTITNRWFKLSRKGTGQTDTEYTFIGKDPTDDVNVEDFEVQDLSRAVRSVPYEEQAAHYGFVGADRSDSSEDRSSDSSKEDDVW